MLTYFQEVATVDDDKAYYQRVSLDPFGSVGEIRKLPSLRFFLKTWEILEFKFESRVGHRICDFPRTLLKQQTEVVTAPVEQTMACETPPALKETNRSRVPPIAFKLEQTPVKEALTLETLVRPRPEIHPRFGGAFLGTCTLS